MRSIRRGASLALAVMTIVAASAAASIARTPTEESASAAPTTMVVLETPAQRVGAVFTGMPDEAAMVLVGAALFGVAAAVKRAA